MIKLIWRKPSKFLLYREFVTFSFRRSTSNSLNKNRPNFPLSKCIALPVGQQPRRTYATKTQSGRLSPQQVSAYLQVNEQSFEGTGVVKEFQCNRLPANNPIEDRDASAVIQNQIGNQFLFGVFDGHGGFNCSQAISERLFQYIALTMSSFDTLDEIRHDHLDHTELLSWYYSPNQYVTIGNDSVCKAKLVKLASEMLASAEEFSVKDNLVSAFLRLDEDIMSEATPTTLNTELRLQSLQSAFEGSCACVAFIDETDLYIANTGDCQAVLGTVTELDDNLNWTAVPLSRTHDAFNPSEVARLRNSHPNEVGSLIKNDRLLGVLAPTRAFGDAQFKWSAQHLRHVERTSVYRIPRYGNNLILPGYFSPPYVTAEPEIFHHKLSPKDKFLVIASDGLWEFLSPDDVIQLVGGHTVGKNMPVSFAPEKSFNLGQISNLLKKRKADLYKKPVDENVATHLIRKALGPQHSRISNMLSVPPPFARSIRDDISVIVIQFDTEFIKDKFIDSGRTDE